MRFLVVVADAVDEEGLGILREDDRFEVLSTVGQPDELPKAVERAHALLVRSSTQVTADLLGPARQLRVVGRAGIGVDNIDIEAATRRGIAVLNAPGANTVSAAEHTLALLLALVRRIPQAAATMQEGEWDRKRFGGTELRGKTLGLLGLGRIGSHVAEIARAFGMHICAYDPFLSASKAKQLQVELVTLDAVLRRADVLSLHAPLNDDTRKILNAARIATMKQGAIVVNAARGALIDEDALVDAVESGHLAGAALDVFDPEPPAADSRLRGHDNIILTPHLAASTQEAQTRVSVEIARSVREALLTGDVGAAVNIPDVSRDTMTRAHDGLDLARKVGCVAAVMAGGPVSSIEMDYGGDDDGTPRPLMLAAVEGVLRAVGVGPVSLVNATMLAEERDIAISRRIGKPEAGFDTTVGVTVQGHGTHAKVVGALAGGKAGRIIRIDDYDVDLPPSGNVLILKNRDVPGVIGRVGTVLGSAGINIAFYHQSRIGADGRPALAAIAIDQKPPTSISKELQELEDVHEVRIVSLTRDG